jgi:excisionase family DNA binding protein
MENIVLISISKTELESLIEKSVRRVLSESSTGSINQGDVMLSIKEASQLLNVAVPTIYHYTSQRQIPFFKRGKRLYFSKDALMEWVKEGKVKTVTEIELEANTYLTIGKNRKKN